MTLKIEEHPNFDKDLLSIQREMPFPWSSKLLMIKAALQLLSGIRKEIGFRGLFSMLSNVKRSVTEALEKYDFSELYSKGLSETDLKEILERLLLGQEMARQMGLEKAKALRTAFSKEIVEDYMGRIYPASEYLEKCEGGFFPNWRRFVAAYIAKCEEKGVQAGYIVASSSTKFEQNMTYCAYVEIAEILGDRELCYWTTCIADDYFFPQYMEKGGCRFTRSATLATGAPVCDFCYEQNDLG